MSYILQKFFGKACGVQNSDGTEVILVYPSLAVDTYHKNGWVITSVEHSRISRREMCYVTMVKPREVLSP